MIIVTKEIMDSCEQAEFIKTSIILPAWDIHIEREKRLSVSCEPGNTYIYITEHNQEDRRKIEDLICIFNSDYDGPLYLDYLKELYYILTKGKKHLTFK